MGSVVLQSLLIQIELHTQSKVGILYNSISWLILKKRDAKRQHLSILWKNFPNLLESGSTKIHSDASFSLFVNNS